MIQTPTVLILGAGASVEHGFPLGAQLIQEICNGLDQDKRWPLKPFMDTIHVTEEDMISFRNRLLGSGLASIDSFLEKNSDLVKVGKAAIAAILMQREVADIQNMLLRPRTDDWYTHLHRKLMEGVKTPRDLYHKNKLTIVTYNYERSLEYSLTYRLSKTFASSFPTTDSARNQLSFLRFIHIHGGLGNYLTDDQYSRPYGGQIGPNDTGVCMERIRVVHEIDTPDSYEEVYEVIDEAEKAIFLGFGYGQENLDRLFQDSDVWNGTFVYGTTYGFNGAALQKVKKRLDDMKIGPFYHDQNFDPNDKCEDVLEKYLQ